ncbi:kinase-like domain-containing protein [Endogone sp. FLAS-F59071]|nr:kinase-like domain-containing protein [Endogone sp. FLAS-F59071]|eukprot:RUS12864.1 kinase-like domain-containing protein [Endogone sp. FLAS-F59071]
MSGHFVNGVPIYFSDPRRHYHGISAKTPTWFSAQGGVYRCREAGGLRQNVAIKKYLVVEKENQDPETFVMPKELVENEIYTMTKCAPHPNILRLHGVHIYKDHIFLVMPLCDGGSLQQYCFDNRVSLSQMVFILKGVSDFGVISMNPTADSSVEEAGVMLFWAPEVCEGKIINRKADIWALGIVVLEMLNGGKAPYEDDHMEEEDPIG